MDTVAGSVASALASIGAVSLPFPLQWIQGEAALSRDWRPRLRSGPWYALSPRMALEQKFLPLISPRSPSYARARSELASAVPPEAISVAGLNRLVEAEIDAWRVCMQIASDTQDTTLLELVLHLAAVHAERQGLVGDLVRSLGGSPPTSEESKATLLCGPTYFEGLIVSTEIMAALRKMYAEIRGMYLRQATVYDMSSGLRHAIHDLCPSADPISNADDEIDGAGT